MASKTYLLVLVLLAAAACAATPATVALASTGGTSGGAAAASSSPAASGAEGLSAAGLHGSAIATWFGPGFYGKQTACGQTLTPQVVGVANRTLPCGTLVQVTYAGHRLTLPVLDRGPYSHSASWDLTAGAARALGVSETVRIVARVVGKTANTPSLGLPPSASGASASGASASGASASSASASGASASGGSLAG